MVAKMKYISITGYIGNMNHVVNNYLSRYDIQLEHASHEPILKPFATLNPYALTLQKAEQFTSILPPIPPMHHPMTTAQAVNLVEEAGIAYEQRNQHLRNLEDDLKNAQNNIAKLQDFVAFETDISTLDELEFTHVQFGRMTQSHFLQFEKFLSADEKIIFEVAKRDLEYVWGAYFTPIIHKENIDAAFASLKFEYIDISSTCINKEDEENKKHLGTPKQLIAIWHEKSNALEKEITNLTNSIISEVTKSPQRLAIA